MRPQKLPNLLENHEQSLLELNWQV
ncbi:hypothetical protein MXB_1035 [Myxobolus squamalis]|nr:hypothetical protein MXB_1035 [Myxobolus squamalis]